MTVPKSILLCLTVLTVVASWAPGQAPPPRERTAEEWINQLGDLDYRKRDEAARALEAMGVKALPALRAARKHADPEVRRRVCDMLPALETATLLSPKRVSLTVEKKSAREVIEALAKNAGYKIDLWGINENNKYSFKWENVTFWQALEQVCQAAGLTVQQSFGDDRLRLQAQERIVPYLWHAGAFCVAAGGFQQTRIVDFSSFPRNRAELGRWDELTFAFTVHAEPRLPLLSVGDVKISAAYDNENTSLVLPAGPRAEQPNPQLFGYRPSRYYGSYRTTSLTAHALLGRPSPRASAVKLIRGSVPVNVLVEQKPEVVTDKLMTAKGTKTRIGTTSFVIEDVSQTPTKQLQVRMAITEDTSGLSNPNDYTWTNSLYNRIEVQDDKGNKIHNQGAGWSTNGPNHVKITLTFGPGGGAAKPAKLIYYVWTVTQHQIPFEFKDLPLP